jgi:hypothetical protein
MFCSVRFHPGDVRVDRLVAVHEVGEAGGQGEPEVTLGDVGDAVGEARLAPEAIVSRRFGSVKDGVDQVEPVGVDSVFRLVLCKYQLLTVLGVLFTYSCSAASPFCKMSSAST